MNYYSGYGVTPGNIQLGVQAPASQLTPEQIAEIQRIKGLGGQQDFTANLNLGGPTAPAAPSLGQQASEAWSKTKQGTKEAYQKGKQGAQDFLAKYPQAGGYARAGLALAGALPAAGTAMEELQAGRPTGALAALAPAGLSAAGAALLNKGPLGTAIGVGLMGLGAILPGAAASGAESARQKLTGEPTKGKEGEFSTQLAMNRQVMNQNLDGLARENSINLQATKDLTAFYNQAQVDQFKAMAPELEKAKTADFVRYQNAVALQGQIQGRLGVLANAGALAQGAQAGNYNLTQAALTNNPYAGATIQAPQIRFG